MESEIFFRKVIETAFGKEATYVFEEKLLINESRTKNLSDFLKICTLAGTILMIFGMLACGLFFKLEIEKCIIVGGILFFAPFTLDFIFQDLCFEKRKREKENLLPDLLLQASIFCDESSLQRTLEKIVELDFGPISRDFERALIEIKKGASIEEALEHIKTFNKSSYYSRVIDLFLEGYKSGASLSDTLKEAAEDMLESQAIIKERQAVMLVTKYTLLFSSAIIVPGILGLIIGLINGLNFSGIGDIGFGMSPLERKSMFELSKIGANIYIIEYSLLAGYFLALQEGNKKQAFVYAPILVIVSLTLFYLAQFF